MKKERRSEEIKEKEQGGEGEGKVKGGGGKAEGIIGEVKGKEERK